MKDELRGMCKEQAVTWFRVLYRHLPAGTEKAQENGERNWE
jgi:hypothetical protein